MRSVLLLFFLIGLGCTEPVTTRSDDPAVSSILFIGNSLTYTNDLPGVVRALLEASDDGPVYVESVAYANYGLQDHFGGGALDTIRDVAWDLVILQQGPSATEGRPSLLEYAERFKAEIEKTGARMAMYMVWPADNRLFDFNGVSQSYRMAAENTGALLFPVGDAWQITWTKDRDLALYGPDGFHPSQAATYLAAMVMYEQITGSSPVGLPGSVQVATGATVAVTEAEAWLLQEAAVEANKAWADSRL